VFAGQFAGYWRDGKRVAMDRNASLPDRCPQISWIEIVARDIDAAVAGNGDIPCFINALCCTKLLRPIDTAVDSQIDLDIGQFKLIRRSEDDKVFRRKRK